MAFDKLFKHLWREVFGNFDTRINAAVGTLDLAIDLILIKKPDPGGHLPPPRVMPEIVSRLANINLFEFKSSRDKTPPHALHKLVGYAGLFCFQEKVPFVNHAQDVTAWLVTALRPKFMDSMLSENQARAISPGIFAIKHSIPMYVVVINEVPCVEANYPLLLLASGTQLQETIRLLARSPLSRDAAIEKYMYESYLLNYEELKSMTETEPTWPADVKRNIRAAIKDLGLKEVIAAIGLKEVIDAVGVEQVERELKRIKAAKSSKK